MKNIYDELVEELKSQNEMIMITKIKTDHLKGEALTEKRLFNRVQLGLETMSEELMEKVQVAMETGAPIFIESQASERVFIEPFYRESRLIILGGGHIAKSLVKFATEVGFSVTVVDDRLSFANQGRFPEASVCLCESFDHCFETLQINSSDYVVIVTRGHRHDMVCLRQVIHKKTAYLGMIGSKRRIKSIKEQFIGEGFDKDLVQNLCAPIGFEIGAVTPAEVAISIMAQVISQKRLSKTTLEENSKKKVLQSDFDFQVIENLAMEEEGKRAIITVLSTKGSVPRKAGAKMIVWPDGRILGSIGGGCSEAEVIQVARNLIETGGYQIQLIDMTGEVAEEEGMVCGGTMEVFIEAYPSL